MKLFLGDQVAGALGQMAQDLERLGPQLEFAVVQAQATASEVQHETIELNYSGNNLVHILLPADRVENRQKIVDRPPLHQDLREPLGGSCRRSLRCQPLVRSK